jgi:hypothetical protein
MDRVRSKTENQLELHRAQGENGVRRISFDRRPPSDDPGRRSKVARRDSLECGSITV